MAVFDSAVEASTPLHGQHALHRRAVGRDGPAPGPDGRPRRRAPEPRGRLLRADAQPRRADHAAGHGGQVLLSAAAAALVMDSLPDGATLQDLGEHQLKGLGRPERVYQLSYPGLPASFPPLVTRRAPPQPSTQQPSALRGKETELAEITRSVSRPSRCGF